MKVFKSRIIRRSKIFFKKETPRWTLAPQGPGNSGKEQTGRHAEEPRVEEQLSFLLSWVFRTQINHPGSKRQTVQDRCPPPDNGSPARR